jgi:hypothetical protein
LELDLKQTLDAAYKLNDWLNFYWNFYVVFTGVVIGWIFNSKGWLVPQRVVVSLFYLGFVAVSLGALYKTYQTLNAATAKLETLLAKSSSLNQALIAQLDNGNWPIQLALHIAGDLIVLWCIWNLTHKAPEAPPAKQ